MRRAPGRPRRRQVRRSAVRAGWRSRRPVPIAGGGVAWVPVTAVRPLRLLRGDVRVRGLIAAEARLRLGDLGSHGVDLVLQTGAGPWCWSDRASGPGRLASQPDLEMRKMGFRAAECDRVRVDRRHDRSSRSTRWRGDSAGVPGERLQRGVGRRHGHLGVDAFASILTIRTGRDRRSAQVLVHPRRRGVQRGGDRLCDLELCTTRAKCWRAPRRPAANRPRRRRSNCRCSTRQGVSSPCRPADV